jgi:hypothetical protein
LHLWTQINAALEEPPDVVAQPMGSIAIVRIDVRTKAIAANVRDRVPVVPTIEV